MDIRYRDGGHDANPVAPFSSYTMLMEFNPLDVIVPVGHSLRIELTEMGKTTQVHVQPTSLEGFHQVEPSDYH